MLTLKFESDLSSTESADTTMMIETPKFRTVQCRDGSIDMYIENEHGVEIAYPLGNGLNSFSRCYVMNSAGQTVGRYIPDLVAPSDGVVSSVD